jgi:hypothetical protein
MMVTAQCGNGAMRYNNNNENGATEDDINNDCDGSTDNDKWRNGGLRPQDVDGDGAIGNNDDDDGDLGLGGQPPPPSNLPTPQPVGG